MTSTVTEANAVIDVAAIREKLAAAETFAMLPDRIWPLTYQDGVATTLRWLLGAGRDPLDPLEPQISPRLLDLRHRLPPGWQHDFASLLDLDVPAGRNGWPATLVPWLPDFLATQVPHILSEVFSFGPLRIDDRLGQHILAFSDQAEGAWFPWHTHGFDDSYISFVLYPFSRAEGDGGETRFSSGEVLAPRAGHAAVFDGRATAHCVSPVTPGTPTRFAITAFYRSASDPALERAAEL